jgi:hypothetical protein
VTGYRTPSKLPELRKRKPRAWATITPGEVIRVSVEFGVVYNEQIRGMSTRRAEKSVKLGGGMVREVEFEVHHVIGSELIGKATPLSKLGARDFTMSAIIRGGKLWCDGQFWWSQVWLPAQAPLVAPEKS